MLNRWMHGRLSLGTSRACIAREKERLVKLAGERPRTWTLDLEDEDEDEDEDLTSHISAQRTSAERRHAS